MQNLLNPRWTLLTTFFPTTILFVLFIGHYTIINSLLSYKNIMMWGIFGGSLFLIGSVHLAYILKKVVKKESLTLGYGIAVFLVYTLYLRFYFLFIDNIFPFDIPAWLFSIDNYLQIVGFIMPTIAHAIFVMVISTSKIEQNPKAWHSFVGAVAVPIGVYVFSQIIFPLLGSLDYRFEEHLLIIGGVVATTAFLFFLTKGIYILSQKKKELWYTYRLVWQIPIALVFPIAGLLLNNEEVFFFDTPPFGDFDNFWFYFLAVANGIVLLIPNPQLPIYRLFLFLARCTTFSYTAYFFLVFIPFLPLSVLAILAFGFGFLMLTPLVLFVFHGQTLWNDFLALKENYSNKSLLTTAIGGFAIIPLFVILTFVNSRVVLNNALEYVYHPDYEKEYHFNQTLLANTIKSIQKHKEKTRGIDFLGYSQTPYLSSLFNWIVLDRLSLSDRRINKLSEVFLGKSPFPNSTISTSSGDAYLLSLSAQSEFNEDEQYWTTWVALDLANPLNSSNVEYVSSFNIPDGCWVSDYYLMIEGRREKGILAEKKTAMWIYSQIRNARRDPGFIRYKSGNNIQLNVFPFRSHQVRQTGIQFIHKEPFQLQIDNRSVWLGDSTQLQTSTAPIQVGNTLYLSANAKKNLPKVKRQAYPHFIIDFSKTNDHNLDIYINNIKECLKKYPAQKDKAKISITNSYTKTISLQGDWEKELRKQKFEGGFHLEMALKKGMVNSYQKAAPFYPNYIVLSNLFLPSYISDDLANFQIAFPELASIQQFNTLGEIKSYTLLDNPLGDTLIIDSTSKHVLAWPNKEHPQVYLPDDKQASIVFLPRSQNEDVKANSKWEKALAMQGQWQEQNFFPERGNKQWLDLVRGSFTTGIMNPTTSFIALENDAQKAMLKKKQEQVLNAHKFLDVGNEPQRMSEPEWYFLFILFCLFLAFKYRIQLITYYASLRSYSKKRY